MKYVIISGNPKKDGLTKRMTDEIIRGAEDGGAEVEVIHVCEMSYCRSCNGGAGKCLSEHRCVFGDDGFSAAQELIRSADAAALISPVYWAEVSEGLKQFMDRFRRCEGGRCPSALAEKPALLVASAGGTGRNALEALMQMERFIYHTGGLVFDAVCINRRNRVYKGRTVYEAAKAMADGVMVGETRAYVRK